ncbi:MAG: hypothetical protein ABIF89_00960 [bacterium]
MKKTLITLITVMALGTGVAFAADTVPTWKGNDQWLKNGFWGKGLGRAGMINAKTEILGMTVADLKAAIDSGKTFAEILQEKGITLAEWKNSVQAAVETRLQQMVGDGKITQDQANKIMERNEERLSKCTGEGPIGWQKAVGAGKGLKKGLIRNYK